MTSPKPAVDISPRLLTKTQAATYCGVCLATFSQACPVKPVLLLNRISRYDTRNLDAWIDSLGGSVASETADLVTVWQNGGDDGAGSRH
jgi:hypothetical protein